MGHFDKDLKELIFYKSKDMLDYYLLYHGNAWREPDQMLQIFNRVGKFKNFGLPHADVDMGYSIKTTEPQEFMRFIIDHVATDNNTKKQEWNLSEKWICNKNRSN